MSLVEDLKELGFVHQPGGRGGVTTYALTGNRHLTYTVHVDKDGDTGQFSWELALGELVHEEGMQVGANELLNIFLYPASDATVASGEAVVLEVQKASERLNGLRLADPDR